MFCDGFQVLCVKVKSPGPLQPSKTPTPLYCSCWGQEELMFMKRSLRNIPEKLLAHFPILLLISKTGPPSLIPRAPGDKPTLKGRVSLIFIHALLFFPMEIQSGFQYGFPLLRMPRTTLWGSLGWEWLAQDHSVSFWGRVKIWSWTFQMLVRHSNCPYIEPVLGKKYFCSLLHFWGMAVYLSVFKIGLTGAQKRGGTDFAS